MTSRASAFVALLLAPLLLGAADPVLVPDVSARSIEIRYSFSGAQLLLFGAILYPGGKVPTRPADIVVVLKGPVQPIVVREKQKIAGIWIARKNEFLGRWIKHGGFWPDPKLRLFRRGCGHFEDRAVHETVQVSGPTAALKQGALLHHCYPTVSDYMEHMNRYSSLGAEMAIAEGRTGFSVINIAVRPPLTFVYNYFFRLGFLDGREGLLQHLYHAVYVSWKYAKVWELTHSRKS